MNNLEYELNQIGKLIEFTNICTNDIVREEQWKCFHDFQEGWMPTESDGYLIHYCNKCDIYKKDYDKYILDNYEGMNI